MVYNDINFNYKKNENNEKNENVVVYDKEGGDWLDANIGIFIGRQVKNIEVDDKTKKIQKNISNIYLKIANNKVKVSY